MSQPRLLNYASVMVTRVPLINAEGEPVLRYGKPRTKRHIETDWRAKGQTPSRRSWRRYAKSAAKRLEERQQLAAARVQTLTENRARLAAMRAAGLPLPGHRAPNTAARS